MSQSLPVLFVTDLVVLPGMVVPVELDEAARAAIDAARASSDSQLLVAPRLDDRYASYGVVATIEQVGRLSGGAPAAVLKAVRRARIGSGVSGPGAALWVDVDPVEDDGRAERPREGARRGVQAPRRGRPAASRGLAGHRLRAPAHRPERDRRHRRLRAVPLRRAQARAAGDPRRRAAARDRHRLDPRVPRRGRPDRQDRRRRARRHGEDPTRVPAAPAARRHPQGARRG